MSKVRELQRGTKIGKYRIEYLIGEGGFGHVYKVVESNTKQNFALKTECDDVTHSFLKNELSCLSHLNDSCFPSIRDSGQFHNFNYFVMNIYGKSISAVCKTQKLSLDITFPICHKMFTTIQTLHNRGFIHRDIKPSNFLVQLSKSDQLVLVDFGLALEYIDSDTGELIQYQQNRFAGTKKYASIFSHKKNQLGRRDDLISWIYSSIEIITGSLPWSNCENDDELLGMKENISPEVLCKDVPVIFRKIFKYLLTLKQYDSPSYIQIDKHLRRAMKENNIDLETVNWNSLYM